VRFPAKTLRVAPAVLVSTILHTIVLIFLALVFVTQQHPRSPLTIVAVQEEGLSEADLMTDVVEIETEPVTEEPLNLSLAAEEMPLSELGELAAVSLLDGLEGLNEGGIDEGLEGQFGEKIHYARTHGLDIVLVFDSTGSMGAEIDEVKGRIHSIGTALLEKIPSTRISLVTYRDHLAHRARPEDPGWRQGREHYVVKGIPLTRRLSDFDQFLIGVTAGGGGDHPEAVLEGLKWAIERNDFSPKSLKVILIFGDAPPHSRDMRHCIKLAKLFRRRHEGTISTITCRMPQPLQDLYEIARAGGGEAHTLKNTRWLLQELLVLTFGSDHRDKVLEFFELN
jgi:hypothetical protein